METKLVFKWASKKADLWTRERRIHFVIQLEEKVLHVPEWSICRKMCSFNRESHHFGI